MSAVRLPVRQRTPEWLEERRRHLGSSDAPVLAGESGSMLALWAEKRGLAEPEFDDDTLALMKIGELLEPSLRALYTHETGRPIRQRKVLLVSREWPVAAASLDAESGRRIVETKWSHSAEWFRATAEGAGDRVPGRVMAQVQWQMFVTGRDVVDVAVLAGRRFHVIEVERDERYIGDLEYMARWFWPFVERGDRPPVDGSDETTRVLGRLHPRNTDAWLPAEPDLVALVDQFREAKAATKAAEDAEGSLANALRALIGDASGVAGLVSWKKNADSQATNWKALAEAYEALLREVGAPRDAERIDALRSLHTVVKEGPRVLRLLGGGKAS